MTQEWVIKARLEAIEQHVNAKELLYSARTGYYMPLILLHSPLMPERDPFHLNHVANDASLFTTPRCFLKRPNLRMPRPPS